MESSRGLQIFKGDDKHAWSIQGNPPFQVGFRRSQGDTVLQIKTTCSDSRCNNVALGLLSNSKIRGSWQEMSTIDITAASAQHLPRFRGDSRDWASGEDSFLALELIVIANRSGFNIEWAPWGQTGTSYFHIAPISIDAGMLDVSSVVNLESINKADITINSGLCHTQCDLCSHFKGKYASAEEKEKLCISCPPGSSLEVVHANIAAGKCVLDSEQRFESIEVFVNTSTFKYLKVFSEFFPHCWNELTTRSLDAVVDDPNCENLGTRLCDDPSNVNDRTAPYQKYCSTYSETTTYTESNRCMSREGDVNTNCFKCKSHLAQCRCGRWKANPGEIWEPYWRGSPSNQNYGVLLLTACPMGHKRTGGLNHIQQQKCIACRDDQAAWPAWNIDLDLFRMRLGFRIEWRSADIASRLCRNENVGSVKLERNSTGNGNIFLTRFSAMGQQGATSLQLNITNENFVVRLAESVSSSRNVKIGLSFSGHSSARIDDPFFFDLGCTWEESPSREEWTHILNMFKKEVSVHGAGVKSVVSVSEELRIGRGYYLSEVSSGSKPAEDVGGLDSQCFPCPAGAICIKGMFIPSTGKMFQVQSREWGSSGVWTQDQGGNARLLTCPETRTRFPFASTGIVDEMMLLSIQACVLT